MNIIQNANRTIIRTSISTLNDIFGRKVFVQPRAKNKNGLWCPAFRGGVLSCPPRQKPINYFLGGVMCGVLVTVKPSKNLLSEFQALKQAIH